MSLQILILAVLVSTAMATTYNKCKQYFNTQYQIISYLHHAWSNTNSIADNHFIIKPFISLISNTLIISKLVQAVRLLICFREVPN